MNFYDTLVIRTGCVKYTLHIDTDKKKSYADMMLSQYNNQRIPLEYGWIDKWCRDHGIRFKKSLSYRNDKPFLWNLKEVAVSILFWPSRSIPE